MYIATSKTSYSSGAHQQHNSHPENLSKVRDLLDRIAGGWHSRAQVKQDELELRYDAECVDFRADLLPFKNHPIYLGLADETQRQILSCGWLAYNEKTVAIETSIVSPACIDILDEKIPGLKNETTKQIICETLVDEAYHILLVKNANRVTREQRGLQYVHIPTFNLVHFMEAEKAKHAEIWKRQLVQLATCVVSEIFVSDYLHLLSEDKTIQPLNRETVAAHRHDELAHSQIFKSLVKCFYGAMNKEQRSFFAKILPCPILWFADLELDVWHRMLVQLRVNGVAEMIKDCRFLNQQGLERVNFNGITALASEVGMLDDEVCRRNFIDRGLMIN